MVMPEYTRKIIEQYLDCARVTEYLKQQQNEDGSYPGLKPNPVVSMYCLRILEALNKKPQYENTYKWVLSLQTGKRGFAEATGENSWAQTTYYGAEMHALLGMRPKFDGEFQQFVLSHQNSDGGFSAHLEPNSDLSATICWVLSALNLGFGRGIDAKLGVYLDSFLNDYERLDYSSAYNILRILSDLNLGTASSDKIRQSYLEKLSSPANLSLTALYYMVRALELLGTNIEPQVESYVLKNYIRFVFKNVAETWMIIDLCSFFGLKTTEEDFADYVYALELPCGGFCDKRETNLLTAYECIQSLMILNEEPKHPSRAADWIRSCQKSDGGFAGSPGAAAGINMQFRAVRCLNILGNSLDKKRVVEYLNRNIFPVNPFDTYYRTYGFCELDELPAGYRKIIVSLLEFQGRTGGFSHQLGGAPDMYATARSVIAISNVLKILESKRIKHFNWLNKIRDGVVNWIKTCENSEGGFSWVPDEVSYMQPTYKALHTLYILREKPRCIDRHIAYLKKLQNDDGGFNGGEKETPSYPLFAYYAVASLLIVNYFKQAQSPELDVFLGI
jgi:hypothetical protein